MNLIDLSTPEKIAEAFDKKSVIEVSEDSKVAIQTDKLRHVKVCAGGSISLSKDNEVLVDSNEKKAGKKSTKKSE